MTKNIFKITALLALMICGSTASATIVYEYNQGAGTFGGGSGLSYDSIYASFNTSTDEFEFTVDYAGTAADGGWLVVSPGPNPKGVTDELAIAYLDADSGNVWVYGYNGANSNNSYQSTDFFGMFAGAYTTDPLDSTIASFTISADSINDALETGFAFGEHIGIWFHPTAHLTVNGNAQGLNSFNASGNGWYDTNFDGNCNNPNNGCITAVPEPRSLVLLLIGFAAMSARLFGRTQRVKA